MHPQALAHHQTGLQFHQAGDLLPAVREYLRALAIDPTQELTRSNLAAIYQRLGEPEKAAAQYLKLLESNPLNGKAYFNLGTLYSSLNQWEPAVEQLEKLLALEPEHVQALLNLGWLYHRMGKTDQAVSALETADRLDPNNPKIELQLGQLYLDCDRKEEARAAFAKSAEHDEQNPAPRLALAECAWLDEMAGEALRFAREVLEIDPHEPRARELCSWCYRMFADQSKEANKIEEYAENLEGLVWLESGNQEILANEELLAILEELKNLYLHLGDLSKLIKVLERLLSKRSDVPNVFLLGESLLKCGQKGKAKEVFRRLTEREHPDLAALNRLFRLAKAEKEEGQVVALANAIVLLDPCQPDALLCLAEDAFKRGDHGKAIDRVEAILAVEPNPRAFELHTLAYRALAKSFEEKENQAEAIRCWREILRHKADDQEALNRLGRLLYETGRDAEATKILKRLLALNPRDSEIAYLLALLYHRLGVKEGAKAILQAILARNPHVAAAVALADIDPPQARSILDKALEWDPRSPLVLVALGKLELKEGQPLKAWSQAQLAIEVERTPQTIALAKDCLKYLALESLGKDNLSLSLQLTGRLLLIDPLDPISLRLMGRVCRRKGVQAKAAEAFAGILALEPADLTAVHGLYQAYRRMSLFTQAKGVLHASLKLKKRLRILSLLCEACQEEGNPFGTLEYSEDLLKIRPNHPQAKRFFIQSCRSLALGAMEKKDLPISAYYWERLLSQQPDDLEAVKYLATIYLRSKDYTQALPVFAQLHRLEPENFSALVNLAWLNQQAGKPVEAIDCYQEALRQQPLDTKLMLPLGQLLRQQGQLEEARLVFQERARLDPNHLPTHVALAELAWSQGDPNACLLHIREILARNPKDKDGRSLGIACLRELARTATTPVERARFLEELLALQPGELPLLESLAETQLEARNLPKAVAAYEKLVQANPRNRRSLFLLGEALAAAGQIERSREVLEALDRAEPHLAALETLTLLHRGEAAIQLLKRLLLFVPDHVPALLRLSELLPPLEALPFLEKLRSILPEDQSIQAKSLAAFEWLARSSGEKVEKEGFLRELLKLSPDHVWALRGLCGLLPTQEAEPFLVRLVSIAPDDASLNRLARFLLKKGRGREAYPFFERLSERDKDAALALAELDRQDGDLFSAESHYRLALHLAPGKEEIAHALGKVLLEGGRLAQAREIFLDLLRGDPNFIPTHLALAEIAIAEKDDREALAQAREILARAPEDQEGIAIAIASLERLAAKAKDPLERSKCLESLHALKPEDPAILEGLGEAVFESGMVSKALSVYERRLRLDPRAPRARFLMAEAFLKAGEIEEAEKLFSLLATENHLAALEALIEIKNDQEALPLIKKLLAAVPDHFPALRRLSGLLPPGEALPVFQKMLTLSPKNDEVLNGLAKTYEALAAQSASPEEKERLLRELLSFLPGRRTTVQELARLLMEREEHLGEAEGMLSRLMSEPDDESSYLLALCRQQMGRRRESLDILSDISPRHPGAAIALAKLAEEENDLQEAEKSYLRALARAPSDPEIRVALAKVYFEQGRPREALDVLGSLSPSEHPSSLATRAEALRQIARQEDEEGLWNELLVLLPSDGEAHRRLGVLLYHQQRFEEALEHLDLEAQPFLAADALVRSGDLDWAKRIYEGVLEKEPERVDAKLLLSEISIDQGEDTPPKLPRNLNEREREIAARCFRKLARRVARPKRYWLRLLDLCPDDTEAMRALASIYLQGGDCAEAHELLEQLNERSGGVEIRHLLAQADLGLDRLAEAKSLLASNLTYIPSLLLLAETFEEEGEEREAEVHYQKALLLAPENLEAKAALGRMAHDGERWEEALAYLEEVPRSEATRIECHRQLASLGIKEEEHWRTLLSLNPKDREGKRSLGSLLHARKDFAEALEYLDPNRQALQVIDCYRKLERIEEAMASGEAAIAKHPGDKAIPLLLGEIAYEQGNPKQALEMAERALALDRSDQTAKSDALKYMEDVVNHARLEGDLTAAVRTLERLRSLAPDRRVLRHLGNTYSELGLYEKALSCFNALLENDPNDRDIAFLVGEALLKSGDKKRAKAVFKRITEQNPHHLPAQLALADLAWQAGEDRQASEHLEKVLSRKPGHRDALDLAIRCYRELAHQAYAAKDLPEALTNWEKINKHDPEDTEALFELGRIYCESGSPAKAIPKLKRVLEREFDEETAFLLARSLLQTGQSEQAKGLFEGLAPNHLGAALELAEMAKGDPLEEERRLKEILRLKPDHSESLQSLAALLLEMDRPQEAIDALSDRKNEIFASACRKLGQQGDIQAWHELLNIHPDDAEATRAIADFHLDRGEDRDAAIWLEKLFRIEADPVLLQAKGDCLLNLREFELAGEAFQGALSLNPNHLPSKFGLARAYWESGNLSEAWKLLAEVLDRRPNYPEARDLAIACLDKLYREAVELNEYEAAAFFLEKQQILQPDGPLSRLADAYRKAENHPKAIETFERLALENPADLEISFGLGQALSAAGKLEDAKRELERLLVLKPGHLPALSLLARLSLRLGQVEEAKDFHCQVLEIDAENPDSRVALGEIAYEEGGIGEALAYASATLETHPDHAAAKALTLACHRRLAKEAERSGDLGLAVTFQRAAAGMVPEDLRPKRRLARVLAKAGGEEEAIALFEYLLELCPKDWDSTTRLATLLLSRGKLEESKKLLLSLLQAVPQDARALALLARVARDGGNPEAAGELLRWARIVEFGESRRDLRGESPLFSFFGENFTLSWLEGILRWNEACLSALLLLASARLSRGEKEIADSLFERCLELASRKPPSIAFAAAAAVLEKTEHPEAKTLYLRSRGELLEEAENLGDKAIARFSLLLSSSPGDPELWRKKGGRLADEKRNEEACACFRKAVALDPKDWSSSLRLADLLAQEGDWASSRDLLHQVLAVNPHHDDALLLLARAHLELNDAADARETALRILDKNKKNAKRREAVRILTEACRILAENGGASARSYWEEILDHEPKDREALLALGQLLLDDSPLEAAAFLERRLKLTPPDPEAMLLLAGCYLGLGRLEEAKKLLKKVLKQDPASVWAQLISARLARLEGDEEEAARLFALAEEADPRDVGSLIALGKAAQSEKNFDEALLRFEQALSVDPEHSDARRLTIGAHRHLALYGEEDQSAFHWERILELSPWDPTATFKIAKNFLNEGDARGEELCRRFLTERVDSDLAFLLAQELKKQGREEEAQEWLDRIVGWDEAYAPALLELADRSWLEGDQEKARSLFERVVESDPFNVNAHLSLSEMALQADDLGMALLEIERVLEFAPERDNAKMLAIQISSRLAGKARKDEDSRGEIGHLKRIIELDPAEIDARYRLAEIFDETERFNEATELCQEMIELGEDNPKIFLQLGKSLDHLGREEEAAIAYEHALEGDPGNLSALLRLADFSWRSQDLDRAWELLETLLSQDPENERGLELRASVAKEFGSVAFRLNNYQDAIAWWQVCLNRSSTDIPLLQQVARAYLGVGDIGSASLLYQQLLERDPDDLDTVFLLADLYRRQGDLNRSEKALRQILQKEPRHIESLVSLARVSQQQGDPKETMNRAFNVLDLDPGQTEALEVLAWSHIQLLEVKAAIDVYQQIAQLKPQASEPQHQLAILYRDTGQFELARKAMTTAIYHSPKEPQYFNTLGTIYSLQGQWEEAEASFNYALQLDPDFGDAYANLGFALMQAGDKKKARPHLERANELISGDSELALSIQCMLELL